MSIQSALDDYRQLRGDPPDVKDQWLAAVYEACRNIRILIGETSPLEWRGTILASESGASPLSLGCRLYEVVDAILDGAKED